VFCTVQGLNEPWAVMAVATHHDPRSWFAEPLDRRDLEYDVYVRYGKMFFMYGNLWAPYIRNITEDGRPERVFFVVRPGELGLEKPLYVVRDPEGRDALWIVGRIL